MAGGKWEFGQGGYKGPIPGPRLNILEDCGHFSPNDQPEKISELLIELMKKYTSSWPCYAPRRLIAQTIRCRDD